MDFKYSAKADKFLAKLAKRDLKLVVGKIKTLANFNPKNPPPKVKKVANKLNLWRIRAGDYRVIFTIDEALKTITIVIIGPRGKVYKNL